MKDADYSEFVASRIKPPHEINLPPAARNLLHMAVGVSTEAGELLSSVKAHVIYQKHLDIMNVIEELGDLEFYIEGLRQELMLTRKLILEKNYEKLSKRYPSGAFSNQHAQERADKQ